MTIGSKKKELNLIPEDQRVISLGSKLGPFLFALLIIGVQLGAFLFLQAAVFTQKEALKGVTKELESQTPIWQQYEPVATAIKAIQAKKQTYDQHVVKYSGMDKKLDKIRGLLPEGVSLSTLDINNEGKVAVIGKTLAADSAYQYYNILKEQKDISELSFESITKSSSEYNFNLKFVINLK